MHLNPSSIYSWFLKPYSKQTPKNINENSKRVAPFFNCTFFRKFKLENSRHLSKEKSSSKFLLSQRNSPAHFWRTEKLILTLRQFWSTLSNPCLTGAGGLRTPRLSLKKIVENVSWNKLMLNSHSYWVDVFNLSGS